MSPDHVAAASHGEMKKRDETCDKQGTDTETALMLRQVPHRGVLLHSLRIFWQYLKTTGMCRAPP